MDNNFIEMLKRERKLNIWFHGIFDFYNLIKGVAIECSKLYDINVEKQIISNY